MKSSIQQFIEDAINGGWLPLWSLGENEKSSAEIIDGLRFYHEFWGDFYDNLASQQSPFLNPTVWRCVSKTRDWNQGSGADCPSCRRNKMSVDWRYYFHHFTENIAMGKTVEESLAALYLV